MTRVLKIVALVGAVLLALGVLLAVVGFAFGGSRYLYEHRNGGNLLGWGVTYRGFGPQSEDKMELESFDSVRVEGAYLELNMKPSQDDRFSIETACSAGIEPPKCTVKNGALEIISNWPPTMKNRGNEIYRVTVLYPSTMFHTVSIDLSACDISFRELRAENMEIRASAADVEIKNSEFGRLQLNNSAGDVDIKDSTAENASLSLNMGDLDADHFDTGGLNVKVNMGDVDISGACRGKTTVSVNMGEIDLAPTLGSDQYFVKIHGTMETHTLGVSTAPYVIDVSADLGRASVQLDD